MESPIQFGDSVREWLDKRGPVVALESTVITHGLPRPINLATAIECEEVVNNEGATAATVGIVAGAFALAYPYIRAGVIMVGTLGGMFALMREWRGSLIAPMTAHFLQNALVLVLLLSLLPVMRG